MAFLWHSFILRAVFWTIRLVPMLANRIENKIYPAENLKRDIGIWLGTKSAVTLHGKVRININIENKTYYSLIEILVMDVTLNGIVKDTLISSEPVKHKERKEKAVNVFVSESQLSKLRSNQYLAIECRGIFKCGGRKIIMAKTFESENPLKAQQD